MILIFSCFLLAALLRFLKTQSIRAAVLQSYLIIAACSLIFTELLSLGDAITLPGIRFSWALLGAGLLGWFVWKMRTQAGLILSGVKESWSARGSLTAWEIVALACIGLILLLTLVIALAAPPNNYDSMTYHLPRVVHWIQQGSVKFYPTSIPRQNHSMPMAEYLILQLQILARSDRYANLVQWSGFLILIVAVMDSARLLGISRPGQFLSGLFAATLPMAILQSSSTQNDLITSVFCLLFANFLLRLLRTRSWPAAIFSGLALGLGLLTKGTAYLFCAAIGLTFAAFFLASKKTPHKSLLLKQLSLVVLWGLFLNLGFYARNQALYANPLSTETGRVRVEQLTAGGLYANLVRNASLHLALPDPSLNQKLSEALVRHLGRLASDPDTTYAGSEFAVRYLVNEDESGNPLHFLAILAILVMLLLRKQARGSESAVWAVSVGLAAILFSALLKWQPWGTRLQLPIFSLAAPLSGLFFDQSRRSRWIPLLLAGLLAVTSLPFLFLNDTRPLVPLFSENSALGPKNVRRFFSNRPELFEEYAAIIKPYYQDSSVLRTDRISLYFAGNSSLQGDYLQIMEQVNLLDGGWIGLHLKSNSWEYPLWVLADWEGKTGEQGFYHVGVEDISQRLGDPQHAEPQYLISARLGQSGSLGGSAYQLIVDTPTLDLFERR